MLQPNRRRGIFLEQARDPHITAEDLDAAVPRLPHDGVLGHIGQGCGRRKTRPQAVTGELLRVEPGRSNRSSTTYRQPAAFP
jgi:hypothetical protein